MQTTLNIFKERSEKIIRKFSNSKPLIEVIDEVNEFKIENPDKRDYHLKEVDGELCLVKG